MSEASLARRVHPPGHAVSRSRVIGLTLVVVSVGLCFMAGFTLYDLRQSTYAQAVNNETNLLKVLSQDIARTIGDYDLSLQAVVDGLDEPGLPSLDPHLQDLLLYDRAASARHLGAILVVNTDGKVLRGSDPKAVGADLGDREWFSAQKDRPDRGLFISAPFTRRVTGDDEVIAMSKAIRSRDGSFAGVVVGTLRLTYFKNLFSQADLGFQGVINLIRLDGTSLMRVSHEAAQTGINLAGSGVFSRFLASPSGSFDAKSRIDGVDRIYAFARVGDLPLVLNVALGRDEVYAVWRAKADAICLAVAALCAMATIQGLRFRHQTRQTVRAERSLALSEAQYRLFADHAQDVIIRLDPTLRRTYVSPAVEGMLGYEPRALMEIRLQDSVHPDDWSIIASSIEDARRRRSNMEATYRLRHKAGHYVWAEAKYSLLREDGGFVVVMRDVSRRKAAEAQLALANAETEAARAAAERAAGIKADFIANMSHELRTPLTGMLGVHDLLKRDPALGQAQRRLVDLASEAGTSLLAIVNDVLDFSKAEAGQLRLEAVAFDTRALVESCRELAAKGIGEKKIEIRMDLRGTLPSRLVGDPTRLRQVLLNLMTNAVKFTDRGHVTVSASYRSADGRLRIVVADTGVGVPADRHAALFDRFTQADNSITRRYGGTGLGLAICKGLVDLMGGNIGIEPSAGTGATFWFEVPLPERGTCDVATSSSAAPPSSKRRLLLAEDSAINAEIIGAMLSTHGYDVVTVGDGAAAVEAWERFGPFDLCLMDFQMPVMDGLTATATIRAAEARTAARRLPIVGLTANVLADDASRCLAAGMDAHAAKPIVWADLFRLIEMSIADDERVPFARAG